MKVAIVSANIGGIDRDPKHMLQECDNSMAIEYFYYTSKNFPFPFPSLSNRLKSKYVKTQMHRLHPGYDVYIWLDASYEIKNKYFVRDMLRKLNEYDAVITRHPFLKSVGGEIAYILKHRRKAGSYLAVRYASEPFLEELDYYRSYDYDTETKGMYYAAGMCVRRSSNRLDRIWDTWWDLCLKFSCLDQTQFNFLLKFNNVNVASIGYDEVQLHYLSKANHKA